MLCILSLSYTTPKRYAKYEGKKRKLFEVYQMLIKTKNT